MALEPRWKNPQGKSLEQIWLWTQDLVRELRSSKYLNGISESVTDLGATKAAKVQPWSESVYIEFPDDKSYPFIDLATEFEVEEVVTECASGTSTLTIEINGTPLGGTANSVSSTRDTQAHSSDNVITDGDDVAIVVSSNSSCEGLSVTLRGTRTLA